MHGTYCPCCPDIQTIIRSTVIPVLLILISSCVILSLFLSLYLYAPLKKLVAMLPEPETLRSSAKANEYAMIKDAITRLESTKNTFEEKYNEISEFQQQCILHEFLIDPQMNKERLQALICGDQPNGAGFLLAVVDSISPAENDAPDAIIHGQTLAPFSIRQIASRINSSRFAILLSVRNREDTEECIRRLTAFYTAEMQEAYVVCSEFFLTLEELPTRYLYCDMRLRQERFIGKEYSESVTESNESNIESCQKKLLLLTRSGNEEAAIEALDQYIETCIRCFPVDAVDLMRHQFTSTALEIINPMHCSEREIVQLSGYKYLSDIMSAQTVSKISISLKLLIHEVIQTGRSLSEQKNKQLVETAQEYIQNNITRDPSLNDIAGSVYLSAGYFSKIFKDHTGMTVMDYVISERVRLACRILLENPEQTVGKIAVSLGYNSTQNFIRQFKKITNMTPEQYRKNQSSTPS